MTQCHFSLRQKHSQELSFPLRHVFSASLGEDFANTTEHNAIIYLNSSHLVLKLSIFHGQTCTIFTTFFFFQISI